MATAKELETKVETLEKELHNAFRKQAQENTTLLTSLQRLTVDLNQLKSDIVKFKNEIEKVLKSGTTSITKY